MERMHQRSNRYDPNQVEFLGNEQKQHTVQISKGSMEYTAKTKKQRSPLRPVRRRAKHLSLHNLLFGMAITLSFTSLGMVMFSQQIENAQKFLLTLPGTLLKRYKLAVRDPNPSPEIVWLMSFPNSGTSYTLRMAHWMSNTSYASNYMSSDKGDLDSWGRSIPLHYGYDEGPFVHQVYRGLPPKYMVTKTHCGGYCTGCIPLNFVHTKESFKEECTSSERVYSSRYGHGDMTENVNYDVDRVKKAIYITRDPFDNIVSRYHLRWNLNEKKNDKEWLKWHPRNNIGFLRWCKDLDERQLSFYSKKVANRAEGVPCHSEFLKYIQWHNRAQELINDMGVPLHYIHYEDYASDHDATITGLLNFLDLESVRPAQDFKLSNYSDHYSYEEREKILSWMVVLSTDDTFENILLHYFP